MLGTWTQAARDGIPEPGVIESVGRAFVQNICGSSGCCNKCRSSCVEEWRSRTRPLRQYRGDQGIYWTENPRVPCAVVGCRKNATDGSHVWIDDNAYLIATCHNPHNLQSSAETWEVHTGTLAVSVICTDCPDDSNCRVNLVNITNDLPL